MYRIITEDINRKEVQAILNKHLDGYTLIEAKGYWKGQAENSLIIEIVDYPKGIDDDDTINAIVDNIKAINHQDAVLVQKLSEISNFI